MSRNLYTLAVVSASCDLRLRSSLAGRHDVEEAEDILRTALRSPDAEALFYRSLLDGWNQTHAVLRAALVGERPGWISKLDDVDERGWAMFEPDELAAMGELRDDQIARAGPGDYAMTAFWDALRDAGRFAAAGRCRVVVLHRVLGPSIG